MEVSKTNYHFSGYASRYGVRCTDNRTITSTAFAHADGMRVPIVWGHDHNNPSNVVGDGILEHRDDGLYVYGLLNDSDRGVDTKRLIENGTFSALSIYADHVKQRGNDVMHGRPIEVSVVYAGANKGAFIDTIAVGHGEDGCDEIIMYGGDNIELNISHADKEEPEVAEGKGKTLKEIIDGMTEEQQNALYYLVAKAAKENNDDNVKHSDEESDDISHADNYDDYEGDGNMKTNVFDGTQDGAAISHADEFFANVKDVFADAKRCGSLKDSVIAHADRYGIEDIEILFPEAKLVNGIDTLDRRQDWVIDFMGAAHKAPFAKIKSAYFDITADEARAMGYGKKGERKIEEVIKLFKRETGPTTIYKKQKFDRDDLIDADFNMVAYIRNEMRGKLDEEIARAALISDGRDDIDPGKIKEECIRPIYKEDPFYAPKVAVEVSDGDTEDVKAQNLIDTIIRSRKLYKGKGNATFYTTDDILSSMLLLKDKTGHYIYKSVNELATTLRVKKIMTVEVMETVEPRTGGDNDDATYTLAGIFVNPDDYTFGAKDAGKVKAFEDFDIDYNQEKYLLETRLCGTLTKPASALVYEFRTESAQG